MNTNTAYFGSRLTALLLSLIVLAAFANLPGLGTGGMII